MTNHNDFNILLGSKSPRRKWIFEQAGFNFSVVEAEVEESFHPDMLAHEVAVYLAEKKAGAFTELKENDLLVTADTLVSVDDQILNKPANKDEALEMLQILSGRKHLVYTGVHIKNASYGLTFCESSEVYFKELTPDEILFYINNYKPFDKAGSYGIQDWMGLRAIEKVNGCFYNVMGFPMARFCKELKEF